jgi:glucose 1-dehydrogenase
MKAVAVFPGKPGSAHLTDIPQPVISGDRDVLVRILRVGLDGTDKEINAAEYGTAPAGVDFLVIGHESFGVVEQVGPAVTEFAPATTSSPGCAGPVPACTTSLTAPT